MPCRISPITRTLKYRSSAATEESQRITPASAREPLRTSETTSVSRTKLKALSSISARQVHLLSTRPPKLPSRDHHDDLLAVSRNHLRPLLQSAPHQLADPLLGFLQLPGHGFSSPILLSSLSRLQDWMLKRSRRVHTRLRTDE